MHWFSLKIRRPYLLKLVVQLDKIIHCSTPEGNFMLTILHSWKGRLSKGIYLCAGFFLLCGVSKECFMHFFSPFMFQIYNFLQKCRPRNDQRDVHNTDALAGINSDDRPCDYFSTTKCKNDVCVWLHVVLESSGVTQNLRRFLQQINTAMWHFTVIMMFSASTAIDLWCLDEQVSYKVTARVYPWMNPHV